jgi:rod shape determining protein RodA
LAWFLSLKAEAIKEYKNFIISGVIAAVYFGLVILQPDFGSAVILFLIWFFMMIFARADKKHLLILGLLLIVSFVVAWNLFFIQYQKDRILTFLQPQANPYSSGYHVRQAMTAVGAGGWLGRGLGFGSQSQLKFVPAATTDFIFAVIAEELGFLGVSVIFFLIGVIFYRLIRAAKRTKNNFSLLFILGVTVMLFCQIMINIGMNIGLVPVTGISLPFLSYGGSYLVSTLALIGIVESIIIRSR